MKFLFVLVGTFVFAGSIFGQDPEIESISISSTNQISIIAFYGDNVTGLRLERAENPTLAFQPMAPGELVSTTFLPSNRVEYVVDQEDLRTVKRVFRLQVIRTNPAPSPVLSGEEDDSIKVTADSDSDKTEPSQSASSSEEEMTDVEVIESEERLIASFL